MADEEPEKEPAGSSEEELAEKLRASKKISWLLDECLRIPGTEIRFGLDPILGILPYGGETVATLIGATILGDAGRKGLPLGTLIKMGGNMILNAVVGVIPVFGDAFSVWFKSNSRNYRMINHYLDSDHGDEEPGGWWPVLLILFIVGLVLVINVASWILFSAVIVLLFRSLTGG